MYCKYCGLFVGEKSQLWQVNDDLQSNSHFTSSIGLLYDIGQALSTFFLKLFWSLSSLLKAWGVSPPQNTALISTQIVHSQLQQSEEKTAISVPLFK